MEHKAEKVLNSLLSWMRENDVASITYDSEFEEICLTVERDFVRSTAWADVKFESITLKDIKNYEVDGLELVDYVGNFEES